MDKKEKRQKVVSHVLKYMKKLDPAGDNEKIWKDKFDKMTDSQFNEFMENVRDGKRRLSFYLPNMKKNLTTADILEVADDLKLDFFEQIYIEDNATGRKFLTPHKYFIVELPIRRAKQYLFGKISIPDSDRKLDVMTGQVIKPDKGSRLSLIETQILMNKNLRNSILELLKVRGGDVNTYNEFKNKLLNEGSVRLDELESNTYPRSTVMLSVILKCMHIDNNLLESEA